jgi:hypothetical protein
LRTLAERATAIADEAQREVALQTQLAAAASEGEALAASLLQPLRDTAAEASAAAASLREELSLERLASAKATAEAVRLKEELVAANEQRAAAARKVRCFLEDVV